MRHVRAKQTGLLGSKIYKSENNSGSSPIYRKNVDSTPKRNNAVNKSKGFSIYDTQLASWHHQEPQSKQFIATDSRITCLEQIPSPKYMDSAALGDSANLAARENVDNNEFWENMIARAKDLLVRMEPKDIALLLNALSRTGRKDVDLLKLFASVIAPKLMYYNSTQFAMILSAYAKAGVVDSVLVHAFVDEIRARIHKFNEFKSPVELSMVMNALSRLGIYDADLYNQFSHHTQVRMTIDMFHVRDLSVIASAFARVPHKDQQLFDQIADRAFNTIREATPQELARLIHSFAKVGQNNPPLFEQCVSLALEKLVFMSPPELAITAFSFGQIWEVLPAGSLPILDEVFDGIQKSIVSSLTSAEPKDLMSIMKSFARWNILLRPNDLFCIIDRCYVLRDKFEPITHCIPLLWAVASLTDRQKKIETSDESDRARLTLTKASKLLGDALLASVQKHAIMRREIPPVADLARMVDATRILSLDFAYLDDIINRCVITNHTNLESFPSSQLHEALQRINYDPESDIMMILEDVKNK
eukprot:GHVL01004427.1.p1 GENE.GHVL01004427.1~~GHVL01004427.1.p1  ORF type:complete len:532 (+),score=46.54 GHVL01004427.1:41-1636(+)